MANATEQNLPTGRTVLLIYSGRQPLCFALPRPKGAKTGKKILIPSPKPGETAQVQVSEEDWTKLKAAHGERLPLIPGLTVIGG